MAAYTLPMSRWFYNGEPDANGTVTVYQSGTTTPVTIYSDGGLTTPTTNPITLDANGESRFYVGSAVALRLDVRTSGGTLIQSLDPVYPVPDLSGFSGDGADLNALAGVTPGTGSPNKALVLDSNSNTTVATETPGVASGRIANMQSVQASEHGGFINRFINGTMDVFQRGASGTVTAGTSAYTADGWVVSATGANIAWNKGLTGTSPTYTLFMATAAGLTGTYIYQRIESLSCYALALRTVTFQGRFFHDVGVSITPTLSVRYANAADNWTSSTVVVSAVSLQPCPSGQFTTMSYTFDLPLNAINGLEIRVDFGAAFNAIGKQVQLTDFDLRATPGVTTGLNSLPPTVEKRNISVEETICQRYYQKTFPMATAPVQNAGFTGSHSIVSNAASAFGGTIPFRVRMRAAPTVVTFNPAATNANWRDVTNTADRSVTAALGSETGIVIVGASGAVGADNRIHFTADASL